MECCGEYTTECTLVSTARLMPHGASPIDTRLRSVLMIGIVLLAVLVVGLTLYVVQQRQLRTTLLKNANTSVEHRFVGSVPGGSAPLPGEPSNITSRTGLVTSLKTNELRLNATIYDEAANRYVTKELTATLTANTTYFQYDKTKVTSAPLPSSPAGNTALVAVSRSSFANGDTVQVFSANNIKGKTRFTAKEVWRILHP